jgi:hypothetical protein
MLPRKKDGSGVYRFHSHDLVEAARKLGRVVQTDGERVAQIYAYFVVPGFRLTRQVLGRIVVETREHPDMVLALWAKYRAGSGEPDEGAREIERLSREYDEKIAAQDKELAQKRRATFIRGDVSEDDDDAETPPGSRRTG